MSAKRICIEKAKQISDVGDKDPKVVINSLDYDSLAKIIMLLPIPERIDMEKVCTKWKEACQLAWYDIKKYKCELLIGRCYDNHLLTQSYLEKILLRCGNYLNELSLSKICNSKIMPFIGDHCKNLTSLECKFSIDSLNYFADDFVQAFTQLDKLKCITIITTNDDPNDKTLDLFEIINSLPEEINQIHLISQHWIWLKKKVSTAFKKFNNLQKLTLHGYRFPDNIIFQEIAEKTTLVYLSIGLYDTPKFFLFDKLVNLEYINLTLELISDVSFELKDKFTIKALNTIFSTCKNLKHLDMFPDIYDIAEIPREKWINFQNLEHLGIYSKIMPDLANTIVEYCKNLKHLQIHRTYPDLVINNTAFKKLTELENLESLKLLPYIELSEESIIAISNNCKKLKRLEIPDISLVQPIDGKPLSSPSVLDGLSKLQYLEHLNVSNISFLYKRGDYVNSLIIKMSSTIIAIANNCKNLKILQILNQRYISKAALLTLTKLKNLKKLELTAIDTTDDIIMKFKGLKELNCSYCEELTNAGIIQFIENNPDLEKIDVDGIDNITMDLVIAADQATKNRTNGIILHLIISQSVLRPSSTKPIIKSPWLVVIYSKY